MSTISRASEEVSISGTGIAHVALVGKPKFGGLLADADGKATARVQDGALQIDTDDINVAIAWRDAWQTAIAQLTHHQQRKATA